MKKSQPNSQQTNSATLLLGLYQRVSTDEQAQVVEGSMDNQRHRLQSFIDIKNMQEPCWGRVVENYVDDGYSAKDTNRPGYQRMMKDLKSGRINAIMVTELSRLSRNIPDFCEFHKVLDFLGSKFLAIKENFDSSTPSGKMMLFNMINLAQFEREQISERVAINCHSRSMRGLLSGGPVILGYDRPESNKTTFVVNETEAAQVKKIFSTFLEQRTIGRTINALEALGIKPKGKKSTKNRLMNEGRWTIASLSFVLQNKSYIGIKEVNKINKNKEAHKLKTWQKYTEVKASWPAIIDEATFREVQKIIQDNRDKERARLETSEERVFLAAQVCKCGQCGRALVGQSAHGRTKVHRYYVHSSKKGDVINCTFKRIRADKIESKIVDYLSEILILAGYFNKVSDNIRKAITVKPEVIKAEKNRLTLELQKLNTAIKNTFRIQAELDPQSEAIRATAAELNDLSRRKALIEAEIEKVKLQETQESDVETAIDDLKSRLEAFRRGWKKSTATARKALIKDLIYGIIVNPSSGLSIQFRLSGSLNSDATTPTVAIPEESQKNIIDLDNRRPQQQPPADAGTAEGGQSHNLGIFGSQVVEFGSQFHSLPELLQVHKNIELSAAHALGISENFADLYAKGLSLSDIAKQTGIAKTTVRSTLIRNGIELRANVASPISSSIKTGGKNNAQPYFGFCYFQGELVPHQKEYNILTLIYNLWKLKSNPNSIANHLNEKKLPPRNASIWNRNSIVNITTRFEDGIITKVNGQLRIEQNMKLKSLRKQGSKK